MDGICHNCQKPLMGGDKVKMTVYAEWVPLKSTVTFSLSRPFDCEPDTLEHLECPC